MLALALARTGNASLVYERYRRARGRPEIERLLTAQGSSHVHETLPTFLDLLKFWRDDAAHGAQTLSEMEASIALLQLLRFAVYADTRWDELTAPSETAVADQ